jgi:hypothetical protein
MKSSIKRLPVVMLLSLAITGCTTVPKRFTQDPKLSDHGGYIIEAEDSAGFQLEIFYKSYSFMPNPDDNIQEAKSFFVTVAQELARRRGKAIQPILMSALQTNSTRNIMDGNYSIYVSGKVEYVK